MSTPIQPQAINSQPGPSGTSCIASIGKSLSSLARKVYNFVANLLISLRSVFFGEKTSLSGKTLTPPNETRDTTEAQPAPPKEESRKPAAQRQQPVQPQPSAEQQPPAQQKLECRSREEEQEMVNLSASSEEEAQSPQVKEYITQQLYLEDGLIQEDVNQLSGKEIQQLLAHRELMRTFVVKHKLTWSLWGKELFLPDPELVKLLNDKVKVRDIVNAAKSRERACLQELGIDFVRLFLDKGISFDKIMNAAQSNAKNFRTLGCDFVEMLLTKGVSFEDVQGAARLNANNFRTLGCDFVKMLLTKGIDFEEVRNVVGVNAKEFCGLGCDFVEMLLTNGVSFNDVWVEISSSYGGAVRDLKRLGYQVVKERLTAGTTLHDIVMQAGQNSAATLQRR